MTPAAVSGRPAFAQKGTEMALTKEDSGAIINAPLRRRLKLVRVTITRNTVAAEYMPKSDSEMPRSVQPGDVVTMVEHRARHLIALGKAVEAPEKKGASETSEPDQMGQKSSGKGRMKG